MREFLLTPCSFMFYCSVMEKHVAFFGIKMPVG